MARALIPKFFVTQMNSCQQVATAEGFGSMVYDALLEPAPLEDASIKPGPRYRRTIYYDEGISMQNYFGICRQ